MLIHGWPQTWYQFRRVITPLADAGYFIIAPDYRGAGASAKPLTGYTKDVMARDLHTLVTKVLGIKEKIHIVGHDIGGMIAHAYTTQFPDAVESVCWGECGLPGSKAFESRKSSMLAFHYTFHNVPDLPELLVAGKERIYLKHMYDRQSQNPTAISMDDLEVYAQSYAQPGALRCGFDVYRAFDEDCEMNNARVQKKGKCKVPCLSLWGSASYVNEPAAIEMCEGYYEDVSFRAIEGSGHWVAEEKPKEFIESVLNWVGKAG